MKKIYYISSMLFLFCSGSAFSQIPTGYYDDAVGLDGFELKTKLYEIISDFNGQSYDALKNLYKSDHVKNGFRDRYYENDLSVLDVYSEDPDGEDPYNYDPNDPMGSGNGEGVAYNREHLIPQSYFNQGMPMRGDAFHVWPVDSKVNGWRDNFGFGYVMNPSSATACNAGGTNLPCKSQNGTLKGKFVTNSSLTVVEPIDEFKGDIARAFLYFATCYENQMPTFYSNSSLNVKVMFDGSKNKVFSDDFLEVLIEWHFMDPPSQREKDINDLLYYNHQGNRNPFIDHPEYASLIWGIGMDVEDLDYQPRNDVQVYYAHQNEVVLKLKNPNKSMEFISVYDMNGRLVQTQKNLNKQDEVRINIREKGVYILKVEGKKLEFNTKIIIR